MKESSPKKNFLYNLIYQILILVIPLITAPYLARVVGAEGVGTYSYTYSIVYYFMLFTMMGVNNYGNRTIAKVRDDKEKVSKAFFEIYFMQLAMGILMIITYIIYIFFFCRTYKNIATIEIMFIISSILDINWFFFGLEEFKKTITRSTFVKILSVILIFLFVKNKNDLWIYTLIMSSTTAFSQLLMWFFLRKKVKFTKITFSDVKKHIKPNLILFIPIIAISLYKMMDKIMLGIMSDVVEVGFYENAEKIINVPMTIITALGTVMLPRMSNIVSKGDSEKAEQYISKSIVFVMFLSCAMSFGLLGVGRNFAPLYFGTEFEKTGILIMILSCTLLFLSFANVIRTQYLIPNEKDNIYIISVILGAVVNLVINILLIPRFKSVGACIGTILAEFTVMFYQAFSVRKELKIKNYIIKSIPFLLKAFIMFICVWVINYMNINSLSKLIIQIVIGGIIYTLLNIKYILSIIDIKKIFRKPKMV